MRSSQKEGVEKVPGPLRFSLENKSIKNGNLDVSQHPFKKALDIFNELVYYVNDKIVPDKVHILAKPSAYRTQCENTASKLGR
jgi:hypothetical protein